MYCSLYLYVCTVREIYDERLKNVYNSQIYYNETKTEMFLHKIVLYFFFNFLNFTRSFVSVKYIYRKNIHRNIN